MPPRFGALCRRRRKHASLPYVRVVRRARGPRDRAAGSVRRDGGARNPHDARAAAAQTTRTRKGVAVRRTSAPARAGCTLWLNVLKIVSAVAVGCVAAAIILIVVRHVRHETAGKSHSPLVSQSPPQTGVQKSRFYTSEMYLSASATGTVNTYPASSRVQVKINDDDHPAVFSPPASYTVSWPAKGRRKRSTLLVQKLILF